MIHETNKQKKKIKTTSDSAEGVTSPKMCGNAESSWYAVGKMSLNMSTFFSPAKEISNRDGDMKLRPDGDKINIKISLNYV